MDTYSKEIKYLESKLDLIKDLVSNVDYGEEELLAFRLVAKKVSEQLNELKCFEFVENEIYAYEDIIQKQQDASYH